MNENKIEPIKTEKVSDTKVKVIRVVKDERPIKAEDWIKSKYPNIFACSMKNSGKTNVIINLLWRKIGPDTKVILVCPTVNLDATWIETVRKLEDKGYNVATFTDIVDDDGTNIFQQFIEEHKDGVDSDSESSDDEPVKNVQLPPVNTFNGLTWPQRQQPIVKPIEIKPIAKKKRKTKKITPKYIIICDDAGSSMRDKYLTKIMKNNRHYKSMVLLSSQYLNDLRPEQIKQLQYVFLFSRFSDDKLLELYKSLQLSVSFDEFYKLYKDATEKQYSFLYIAREGKDEFRKGFTEKYVL